MFIVDAHLDLSMNAMEWNRNLREPISTIRQREKGMIDKPDRGNSTVCFDVLMETHGDLVWAHDVEKVMKAAAHPNVGLVWDPSNMWTITKEPPSQAYRILKKYIHHTHIKDAKLVDGKPQYCRLGQGEVPIFEAIDALSKGGYKGYYSFEWEKLWHPELEEPETALVDYPVAMKKHFE